MTTTSDARKRLAEKLPDYYAPRVIGYGIDAAGSHYVDIQWDEEGEFGTYYREAVA